MSELMRPIQFEKLMKWAFEEYDNHGSIFGIKKEKIYSLNRFFTIFCF